MSKPWYTFRTAFSSDGELTGAALQAKGPAPRKGREGPLLEELAEVYEVGENACNRLALAALRLAHERGWQFVRIRIKERTHRKRLKRLLNEEAQPADETMGEFYRLASTFQEVAIRAVPRGNDLECRYLAREAIGLPRRKSNSTSSAHWLEDLNEEEFVELHERQPPLSEYEEIPF